MITKVITSNHRISLCPNLNRQPRKNYADPQLAATYMSRT